MKDKLDDYGRRISHRLMELMDVYSADKAPHQQICAEAMRYSLEAGGKRIRPVLVLEFAKMLGGSEEAALDAACALEMIHTFSLIHDDLPCMDDDDMRRGKPSCHKAYGEAVALLAGDALENFAFEVIADEDRLSYEQRVKLIKCLSRYVGIFGMIGGQTIDIQNVGKHYDGELLLDMYSMKTGALIKCACEMGCICAGRYDMIQNADKYAESLGLAFQIVDDILDITADEKELGKPVHSDMGLDKGTYPAVFGLKGARDKAAELTAKAVEIAGSLPEHDFLVWLTEFLLRRTY